MVKINNNFFKHFVVVILAICVMLLQSEMIVGAAYMPRPPIANPRHETERANNVAQENETEQQAINFVNKPPGIDSDNIFIKEETPVAQVFQNLIVVEQGMVTLKVVNYPVIDLLNTVFGELGKKILISSDIQAKVSVQLNNSTPEELLDLISFVAGLNWSEKNGVFLVSTSDKLVSTSFFPVKHGNLSEIKNALNTFGLGDKLILNTYPRGILASASPGTLKEIKSIINELDKHLPSIKVEFQVVEINKSEEKKIGISWHDIVGTYDYSRKYGSENPHYYDSVLSGVTGINKVFSTGLLISAQKINSIGKILAQPYIITSNNSEAYLSTGDEIPIFSKDYNGNPTVEYKRVGIELFATPSVVEGNLLNINARTVVNIISGQETQQGLTVPRISSREARTTMNIISGETIVIGGLIKEEDIKSVNSIPFLSKLPFLGKLFKSTNKKKTNTEILIFITPTLVEPVSKIMPENSTGETVK